MILCNAAALKTWLPSVLYMEWHDRSKDDWPILFKTPLNVIFEILLRSTHSVDTHNPFCANRFVDGDRAVSRAIRVMYTVLATEQAVGTAASLNALSDQDPDLNVRNLLLRRGASLDWHNLVKVRKTKEPAAWNLSQRKALQRH
jgi:hypothetical protein